MKIATQLRLARFAGLLLLSLLVLAVFVMEAPAINAAGSGTGGGAAFTSVSTNQPGTQGRGGVSAPVAVAPAAVTQPASSGTSSTTWILVGIAAAVLVAGLATWAIVRRRRSVGSQAYCAQHPEDAMCTAA